MEPPPIYDWTKSIQHGFCHVVWHMKYAAIGHNPHVHLASLFELSVVPGVQLVAKLQLWASAACTHPEMSILRLLSGYHFVLSSG